VCLGELGGVTQEVNIFDRQVTPDPNASGIGLFSSESYVLKVYPAAVNPKEETDGYLGKKATSRLSKGLHSSAVGHRDLFQDGVQSLLFWDSSSSPDNYAEETVVVGQEAPSFTYHSQHANEGSLLMVTPFSRYSKYLEIKRTLKG